jgi:peptide/nickel transport system permease protein
MTATDPKHRTLAADVWQQFRRHKGALAGVIVLAIIVLGCSIGPWIYWHDPFTSNLDARNLGPSLSHPFGTDIQGRDLLARILIGGRVSLAVGLTAMLLGVSFGTLIGILAGYFSKLDGALMRLTDLFLALPILPLLLVCIMLFREPLRASLGPETGIFLLIVFVIGLTSWMQTARVVRGEVLSVKNKEFVLAAASIGTRHRNIILRHLLPNVLSPVIVSASLGIASAILVESALSFLGLGFPSDLPTWGRLLYDSQDYIGIAPLRVITPGIMISATVLCVNFIGDGLRDALDPQQRGR